MVCVNFRCFSMSRDFTLEKYRELCRVLQERSEIFTFDRYLSENPKGKVTVLRHDVDRSIQNALRMAQLEHEAGIRSSYYFRYPGTFVPNIIGKIRDLGHEVGYHYEVLSMAKGDYDKAIGLFRSGLGEFRKICEVATICMHGSPLSKYDNRDLWKKYDFRDFGIKGEAYLSMADKGLIYLTDTGRSWGGKHSVRDAMPGARKVPVETTDDLIAWIGSADENAGLYFTVHPERWAPNEVEWAVGSVTDFAVNMGKNLLRKK